MKEMDIEIVPSLSRTKFFNILMATSSAVTYSIEGVSRNFCLDSSSKVNAGLSQARQQQPCPDDENGLSICIPGTYPLQHVRLLHTRPNNGHVRNILPEKGGCRV